MTTRPTSLITTDHATITWSSRGSYSKHPEQKSRNHITDSDFHATARIPVLCLWPLGENSSTLLRYWELLFPQQSCRPWAPLRTFFGIFPFHKDCLRVVCSKCNIQLCLGWKRSSVTYFLKTQYPYLLEIKLKIIQVSFLKTVFYCPLVDRLLIDDTAFLTAPRKAHF